MSKYPQSERYIRDLLREAPPLMAFLSNDTRMIDIDHPDSDVLGFQPETYIIVTRAGGTYDPRLWMDTPAMNFQCYGSSRMVAHKLALTLMGYLGEARALDMGDSRIETFDPPAMSWAVEGDGTPRYIVTCTARVKYRANV